MSSDIEILRQKLFDLRKKRDDIIMEKGLVARENNDLRENFAYEYLESQERMLTAKILSVTKDIEDFLKHK